MTELEQLIQDYKTDKTSLAKTAEEVTRIVRRKALRDVSSLLDMFDPKEVQ